MKLRKKLVGSEAPRSPETVNDLGFNGFVMALAPLGKRHVKRRCHQIGMQRLEFRQKLREHLVGA